MNIVRGNVDNDHDDDDTKLEQTQIDCRWSIPINSCSNGWLISYLVASNVSI